MQKVKSLLIGLVIGLVILSFIGCGSGGGKEIRISGAWALFPMMNVWAEEYQKLSDIKIEVAGGGAGKGMSDVLSGQVDIAMCSRPVRKEEVEQGAFYLAVAKDAVVATVNSENPVLEYIQKNGLSRRELEKIFMGKIDNWGQLAGKQIEGANIVVYGRSDASGAAKVWADYLGNYTQSELQGKAAANFSGDQALAHAVINEKNAIGFNNLNYAYNVETGKFSEGIRAVPIDLNSNGILDKEESFYETRGKLVESISVGTYPSPPARFEYVVSKGPFKDESKEFVKWILKEGQKLIPENGYVPIPDEKLKNELKKIENTKF